MPETVAHGVLLVLLLAALVAGCSAPAPKELPVLVQGTAVAIAPGDHVSYGVLLGKGQTASWTWTSDGEPYTDISAQAGTASGFVDGFSTGSSGTYTLETAYSDHVAFTWGNRGDVPLHVTFEVRSDGLLEWSTG